MLSREQIKRAGFLLLATALIPIFFIAAERAANLARDHRAGTTWPRDQAIRYYNDSGYQASLNAAIEQWQQTGLIRFEATANPNQAGLVFHDSPVLLEENCDNPGCIGHADRIGYIPGRVSNIYLEQASANETTYESNSYVRTIVHEIGHVLGLTHADNDCSIMASARRSSEECYATASNSFTSQLGTSYRCGPFADDIARLEELYNSRLTLPGRCNDSAQALNSSAAARARAEMLMRLSTFQSIDSIPTTFMDGNP